MAYNTGTYTLVGVAASPISAETAANQSVTYNIVGVIDTINIQSDAGSTTAVNQTVDVADTLNLVAAGGSIVIGTGVAGVDVVNATISAGGSLTIGGTLASLLSAGSLAYGAGGGTLYLGTPGTLVGLSLGSATVSGFNGAADIIDNRALQFSGVTGYTVTGSGTGTQVVAITDTSGNFTFSTNAANLIVGSFSQTDLNAGTLKFSADGSGGTRLTVCFLGGTRIATPDGECAVQDLRAGDLVAVRNGGETGFRPVSWIGGGRMNAACRIEEFPVRVRAGAFADAVPHRDLLVTSEHCIHVDGKLVPARMLVNGRSIVADTEIADYDYFHVELDSHAILLAEGLETESYLDTGNRGNFHNSPVPNLRADFAVDPANKSWAVDAAAPLAVDRETVEPIWRFLESRAVAMGIAPRDAAVRMVDEPDLRLVTDGGLEIEPALSDGRTYAFVVPANVGGVSLRSRTFRPSEIVGPFLDDRRDLGVLVGSIGISAGRRRTVSTLHLTQPAMPGWHGLEGEASCRWTDGKALIPMDLDWSEGKPVFLDVEIVRAGPYLATALAA